MSVQDNCVECMTLSTVKRAKRGPQGVALTSGSAGEIVTERSYDAEKWSCGNQLDGCCWSWRRLGTWPGRFNARNQVSRTFK
jgi:hypothetical protein